MFNLDNIFCYILNCFMEITVLYGFRTLTNNKEKIHWKYLILVFIFPGIITLLNFYSLDALRSLASILFYFIICYLTFQKNIKETIYYCCIITILGILLDIFTMFRITILSTIKLNIDLAIIKGLDTIIMEIILLILLKNKKLIKGAKELYNRLTKIAFPYLRISLLITVLLSLGFLIFFIIKAINIDTLPISFFVLIISVIILIMVYINKEYKYYSIKETNDYLIKDNEFYITLLDDYRVFKHNIFHQLNGLKTVANKKTINLIEDIINEYNETSLDTPNIKKMPLGINRIIYEKMYYFKNKEIRLGVDNNIKSDLYNNLTPRSYNLLCEALGILIDNALQATSKTKEKILMIDMKEDELSYQIKIINTFEDLLDLEKLGSMKYTTKNSGHGFGLFSLIGRRKIKIKTSIINDLFLNEIIIEKNLNE